MSTFRGGPASGIVLSFRRGPLFLRVVVDASGGFDVLDQLEDDPSDGEEVFVYRRVGESRPAHLLYRGKGGRERSGWYEFADYEYVELDAELRERLRDRAEWRSWAEAQ